MKLFRRKKKLSEDEVLLERIFELLRARATASPYEWNGLYAQQIRNMPPGLRAMAATHWLDLSITLDDIGWHFLNFGEPELVQATSSGLRELGLVEVAEMFDEAYSIMQPHLGSVDGNTYYDKMAEVGKMERLDSLDDDARELIGKDGIYTHWVLYARKYPERVFA